MDGKQDFHQNLKIYNNKHTREMVCTFGYHYVNTGIMSDVCRALCLWDIGNQRALSSVGRRLLSWVYNSGVDEIHPEYFNVLDVMGLFWLTCLCNLVRTSVVMWSGKLCWWFSIFIKGNQRVCSNYRGITILSLREKEYVQVQEKRVWLLVKILLEGTWDIAQPLYMCFI